MVTFVINNLRGRLRVCSRQNHLLQYNYCYPWSKACYFVKKAYLNTNQLQQPLNPFVALFVFLITQVQSLFTYGFPSDPTMIYLCDITHQLFHQQITDEEQASGDLRQLCDVNNSKIQQALDDISTTPNNLTRAKTGFQETLALNGAFQSKY